MPQADFIFLERAKGFWEAQARRLAVEEYAERKKLAAIERVLRNEDGWSDEHMLDLIGEILDR